MAGLKKLTTRIINKHATAAVWNTTNFTPLQGELIVYDPGYDSKDGKTYSRERFKIGDGKHTVQELPFAHEQEAVVTPTTKTINVITQVSKSSYTSSSYTAPSMGQEVSDDLLVIKFDAGSYTPATFTAGEVTKTEDLTYVSDVDVTLQTPTT